MTVALDDQRVTDVGKWFTEFGQSSRSTCRRAQLDMAHSDDRIFSVEGDLGLPAVPFDVEVPRRYLQMGIAEADMVGVACGLAMRGKVPFVNSFASFITLRAAEQVRLEVAYHQANVKLVGSYAGISGGPAGPTHHCIEDVAVLRAVPGVVILSPADAFEAYKATWAAARFDGPVYIRVGRAETAQVYAKDYRFEIGKSLVLRNGTDVTIIATGGAIVPEALEAAASLEQQGLSCRVLNVHTIKPLDEEAILSAALETGAIVTVEEHNVLGGLGGAVAELVLSTAPVPVLRVGVADTFCETTGPYEDMMEEYGLNRAAIARKACDAIGMKKSALSGVA